MANRGGRHGTGDRAIVGGVGTPPPPGAPVESAQPITPEAQAAMAAKAAANEKPIPPLKAQPQGEVTSAAAAARAKDATIARGRQRPPVIAGPSSATAPTNAVVPTNEPLIVLTDSVALPAVEPPALDPVLGDPGLPPAPPVVAATPPQPEVAAPGELGVPPAPLLTDGGNPATGEPHELPIIPADLAPPKVEGKLAQAARDMLSSRARSAQPAASNTDSPARGIPTHQSTDPGKQITGGFGDAIDQQYFPLDGSELRAMVRGIMNFLDKQLEDDLRFSVALCYPRVSARVVIQIRGYVSDMDFDLTRAAEHSKTPIGVAEAHGDKPTEFELEGNVAEFTADGESVMPPNAIRGELGLDVPRKQRVPVPTGGFTVIDRPS